MNKKRIAVVSGGFDPLHSGHIAYLKDAKNYGEKLIVLLNSDNWLIKKKGKNFLSFDERKTSLAVEEGLFPELYFLTPFN